MTFGQKTPLDAATYALMKALQLAASTMKSEEIKLIPFQEGHLNDGTPIGLKLLTSKHTETGLPEYCIFDRESVPLLRAGCYEFLVWDLKKVDKRENEYVHIRKAPDPHYADWEKDTTAQRIIWRLHHPEIVLTKREHVHLKQGADGQRNAFDLRLANLTIEDDPRACAPGDQ